MDRERIAELRLHEKHLRASGQMVGACLGECLDALEATQAELATAREVIEESMEARRTSEAEGGALQQANTEIDRLRAELAALRGQAGGVVPEPFARTWKDFNAGWSARTPDLKFWSREDEYAQRDAAAARWEDAIRSALSAARERIREVEAGMMIPRPSADEIGRIWNESRQDRDVVNGILDWARQHIQALPSSRVAGEGEVVVPEPEISTLASLAAYSNPADAVRAALKWAQKNATTRATKPIP